MTRVLELDELDALIGALSSRGYDVVGPTVRDGAIAYDEIESAAELPAGWTDVQDGGSYRLRRRDDDARFGFAVGPTRGSASCSRRGSASGGRRRPARTPTSRSRRSRSSRGRSAAGTVAEGAAVDALFTTDPTAPDAQGVLLETVDLELSDSDREELP
jgi:hypothetical protein